MDRKAFLKNLRSSKVKLHPLQLDGWDGLIYLRPQTVGEIREILMRDEDGKDPRASIKSDSLYLARGMARLVRDETGELLFNADDDAQMAELMEVLAESAPSISKQINDAMNAISNPNAEEVDTAGKSPSANTS